MARQTTKNSKEISRKLRDDRSDNSEGEPIEVETALEKPLKMPHRMRSNATFQPKSVKIEPQLKSDREEKVSDRESNIDSISQLAIDFNMQL